MSFGLLRKSEPEKVQRRSREIRVRRETYDLMQPREEEASYYCHLRDKSSQGNQRRPRQTNKEQPISNLKVFSKSYTANQVAKGKAEDRVSKVESRTRTTGRVHNSRSHAKSAGRDHNSSSHVESRGRVQGRVNHSSSQVESTGRVNNSSFQIESKGRAQGKTEPIHSRTRDVRCFKCQGRGHYANECTHKKTMVLLEHGESETKQEVEKVSASEKEVIEPKEAEVVFDSLSSSEEHVEILGKDIYQDQLLLELKNEEAHKQSLGSTDDSAEVFTQRYSLMSTPESYILEFKVVEEVDGDKNIVPVQHDCEVQGMKDSRHSWLYHCWKLDDLVSNPKLWYYTKEVEHVDFVFGDSAFNEPEKSAKVLILEFLKTNAREEFTNIELIVKEGSFLDFSRKKKHYGSFELVMEIGVAETLSFDHCLVLKGHMPQGLRMNHIHSAKIGIGVQRHGPIVDKVKDARKVMELATLYDFEVPTASQERSISLCLESNARDDIDLRANLFQEEGDDTIMESIKDNKDGTLLKPLEETQEHELEKFKDALKRIIQVILVKEDNQRTVGSFYDEIIKLPKKTHLHCSAQMKSEINWFNSMTTWIIFSTHRRLKSKWNQFNQSSDEGDIEFTSQMIFRLLDLDQRTFNGGLRANKRELSYEPNFSGILIHPRITSNWISIKIGSALEDMNFTNRMICFRFNHASRPKIEFHSPTQELFRQDTTWRMLRDLLALQQDPEPKESPLDHKVTAHLPKRVNLVLNLKSSRPDWFVSFQNYVWHPGTSSKPNKSPRT